MADFDAEFVVTPPQILHERVTVDHDRRGPIRSKAAHRPQPRAEPSMIALDPIVRILRRFMEHVGKEVVNDAQQRCSQICGDICRTFAARQHHLKVLGGSGDIASSQDEHIA